jgi:EmrB/QacA subfamily drug resistance transporter
VSATDAPTLGRRRIIILLIGLVLGNIMAGVEGTIVATARPFITADLGRFDLSAWIFVAYQLTQAVSTNLWGKFSDLLGRKWLYQLSIVVFMVGSLTCGLSTSMPMLIAGRAIQGIGSGGLFTLGMVIMGDVLSPRERGRYVGYMAGTYGIATVLGPFVGGAVVDHASWRWVFFMMLPFGVGSIVLAHLNLNLPFHRRDHVIDYAGSGLMIVWVTALVLYGELGDRHGFTSPTMLTLLVVGLAALVTFVRVEQRASEPVLPIRLFRDRTFVLASASMFLNGVMTMVISIMAPLFLQIVTGVNATRAGVLSMPMVLGMLVASIYTGTMMTRTGRYRIYPILGSGMMAASAALLATMGTGTPKALPALYMFFAGAGANGASQVLIVAVQNRVPHADLGIATSATSFFRSLGNVAGSALYSALLLSRLDHWLPRLVPDGSVSNAAQISQSPKEIQAMEPAVRDGIVQSFANSLHTVFLWLVPVTVVLFLIALAVPEHPLRDKAAIGGERQADDPLAPAVH